VVVLERFHDLARVTQRPHLPQNTIGAAAAIGGNTAPTPYTGPLAQAFSHRPSRTGPLAQVRYEHKNVLLYHGCVVVVRLDDVGVGGRKGGGALDEIGPQSALNKD
jgi:hypothetical protein